MNDQIMVIVGMFIVWLGGIITGHVITSLYYKIQIQNILATLVKVASPRVKVSDLYPKKDYKDESDDQF